jgi:hypothetical protein
MVNDGHLLYFRWLEPRAEPRKVSGLIRPAVLNNRHHLLPTLPKLWLGKWSCSTYWYKHSRTSSITSSEEVEMITILPWLVTRISSVHSLLSSVKLKNLWMLMLGSISLNQSSLY